MHERLVRSFYARLAEGGPPGAAGALHLDVVWHVPGDHPLAGVYRGREAVLDAMCSFERRSGGTIRTELLNVAAAGEYAVAFLHAVAARGERAYDQREFDVFRIADDKVAELWSFSEEQRRTDAFWA